MLENFVCRSRDLFAPFHERSFYRVNRESKARISLLISNICNLLDEKSSMEGMYEYLKIDNENVFRYEIFNTF